MWGLKMFGKHVPLVGGSDEVSIPVPIPIPAPGPIDPRPDQHLQDNLPPAQRFIDHDKTNKMNDVMRDMRVEMEKREQGEARRVSEAVEQAGYTGETTQNHHKDNHGIYGSDKRVKFTLKNNT